MNSRQIAVITAILSVFMISIAITPAVAQDTDIGINYSDLADEIRDQVPSQDIRQTIDSDTVVREAEWDAQNNTAYITIFSSNREDVTIVDSQQLRDNGYAPNQFYTVSGEETLRIDAMSSGGRQVITISTPGRGGGNVYLKSVNGINWTAQENILLVAFVTSILLVFYTLYNWWRKDLKENQGVWDLVTKQWIQTTQESDTMEIERWRDYPKYYYQRLKEVSINLAKKPLLFSLSGVLILIADRLLLDGYVYFTLISNSYIGTKISVMLMVGTLFAYPASLYIVSKKYPLRRIPIMVIDWGEIGAQDLEDVLDPSKEIENIHESVRLVEMSDTVYKRFNILIEDSLAEIPYGETNRKMKIARRIDFDENEILPNWQQLHSQKKVMEHQSYAKLNTILIKDYVRKVQTQISRIAGYKEKTRQEQTRQVAKDISKVLSGDKNEAGEEIEQLTEALLQSDAMDKKVGDVEQEESISDFDAASLSNIVPDADNIAPDIEGDKDE